MKNRKISDPIYILMFIGIISVSFWGCGKEDVNIKNTVNYSSLSNWTFYPENPANDVDVFFVAPTVFSGNDSTFSMPLNDSILMYNFTGAINMEKLIYDNGNVNFYAPYYRQAGLNCYAIRGYACVSTNSNVNNAFELAYKDVEDAFYYYLSVSNKPFVLAGFSQGGEMLVELIKNIFDDPGIQGRFIAAYAIGWRLLPAEVESHAHLKQAKREDDLGVVICYSSEAEFIDSSIIVPNTTLSINPLSWTTD
ncbi:MAG: DUF3089 domain-containing protein, partial [Bacteroidota bacterium]|nr:DUF3089 domain-containing protein [Bacteroidota bacterium]